MTGVLTVAEGRGRDPAGTFSGSRITTIARCTVVEWDLTVSELQLEREREEAVVRA